MSGEQTSTDTSVPPQPGTPGAKSGQDSETTQHSLEDVDHVPKHGHGKHHHKKIDIHFFDPHGIERLRRSLTGHHERSSMESKDDFVVDDSFDLSRTLRTFMDKCVTCSSTTDALLTKLKSRPVRCRQAQRARCCLR